MLAILALAGLAALVATTLGRRDRRAFTEAEHRSMLEAIGWGRLAAEHCGLTTEDLAAELARRGIPELEAAEGTDVATLEIRRTIREICPALVSVTPDDAVDRGAVLVEDEFGSLERWAAFLDMPESTKAEIAAASTELESTTENFLAACAPAGTPSPPQAQEAARRARELFGRAVLSGAAPWDAYELALEPLWTAGRALECWDVPQTAGALNPWVRHRTGARRPERWHYIDKWFWNGQSWEPVELFGVGPYYFEHSHPADALGVYDRARFPNGATDVRCFFWDGAWRRCEWSGATQ